MQIKVHKLDTYGDPNESETTILLDCIASDDASLHAGPV